MEIKKLANNTLNFIVNRFIESSWLYRLPLINNFPLLGFNLRLTLTVLGDNMNFFFKFRLVPLISIFSDTAN